MARKSRLKPADVPLKLKACGTEILVKLEADLKVEDEVCLGAYTPWEQILKIDLHHPKHLLKDTLIHEWLHGVLHLSGITPLMDDKDGLEEAVVRAITSAILPAIDLSKITAQESPKTSRLEKEEAEKAIDPPLP